MDVSVIRFNDLTTDQLNIWNHILNTDSSLSSPCFSHQYIKSVSEVTNNTWVAVIRVNGLVVAFFPFQEEDGCGYAAGKSMTDYQGLIANSPLDFSVTKMVRSCGLKSWEYQNGILSQAQLLKYSRFVRVSPKINLSMGLEHYFKNTTMTNTEVFSDIHRKINRLEAQMGKLHFEWHSTSEVDFEQVFNLKHQQYVRTNSHAEILKDWEKQLMRKIFLPTERALEPVLSVLKIDSEIIAGHFGMKRNNTIQYWYPSYDIRFKKYSPGLILLWNIIQHSPRHYVDHILLGTGFYRYKRTIMNDYDILINGIIGSGLPSEH